VEKRESFKISDYEFWAHIYDAQTKSYPCCDFSIDGGVVTVDIEGHNPVCLELKDGKLNITGG